MYRPSYLGRLACPTCNGHGSVGERGRAYDGCDVVNEQECPDCRGSGYRKCEMCGEEPAVGLSRDGDAYCRRCIAIDEGGAARRVQARAASRED